MRSLYHDGQTVMHRLPAGAKLAGLMVFAVLLFLTRSIPLLALAMLATGAIYLGLGQPLRVAIRPLIPILVTILAVVGLHLVFNGIEEASVTGLRLTALMLLAASVTVTTSISDFIAVITRAAMPLERLGLLKAADIGLAVGLVVRFIPEIMTRYDAIREAHRARGLKPRAGTVIAPLIIATLKDADSIAAAIDARGIRGQ
jgi:biotin transport system permease protein